MTVSIRLQIKTLYKDLSLKEQAIADYILENPSKVSHSSISDLSNELGIADSTFFQFTKKLGYNGFKDFKMAMLMQENDFSAISIHENIQKSDNELTMAQKVFDSNMTTLTDTKNLLKEEDLKLAAAMNLNDFFSSALVVQKSWQPMPITNFCARRSLFFTAVIITSN